MGENFAEQVCMPVGLRGLREGEVMTRPAVSPSKNVVTRQLVWQHSAYRIFEQDKCELARKSNTFALVKCRLEPHIFNQNSHSMQ